MKKTLIFVSIALLSISSPISSAQMPSVVTGPAPVAAPAAATAATVSTPAVSSGPELEQAGVVAAVSGKVEIKTKGQTVRTAVSGQPVFIGEEVTSDAQGHLQILFLDQTVFTIGPNSRIVIDEFVYDPKTRDGKIKASITKGVFRYVSGKIAAKQSKNVSVQLPTATLGFRGTIVGGQVLPDNSSLAALLGPGDNNDGGERTGSFVMNGTGGGGGQQEVNRTGFGVTAGPDGNVSGVFQLTEDQLNGLTSGLGGNGGNAGNSGNGGNGGNGGDGGGGLLGGGSAADQSGSTNANTGQNTGIMTGLTGTLDTNNDTSTTAAQDAAASESGAEASQEIADGITMAEQLTHIATGTYYYYGSGPFAYTGFEGGVGVMNARCEIDFGSKTVGGGDSYVEILRPSGSSFVPFDKTSSEGGVSGKPFPSSGAAVFQWTGVSGTSGGTFPQITVVLSNTNGVVANQATMAATYQNSVYTGAGAVQGNRTDSSVSTPQPPGGLVVG